MKRNTALYLRIGTVALTITTAIACEKGGGSDPISDADDAGKSAQNLDRSDAGEGDEALVRAIEFATGVNHDSPDVDWPSVDGVAKMWRIASITSEEKARIAFSTDTAKMAVPVRSARATYENCEAEHAPSEALDELLPVLFQHRPGDDARAKFQELRDVVAGGDLVRVRCEEAPVTLVSVANGKIVASREALDLSKTEKLEPREDVPEETDDPGGPPPATIAVTSPVEGTSIVVDETTTELPHELNGINPSHTLRFKVKAPRHLASEVGALPLDVVSMLHGEEAQTEFHWVVWPLPLDEAP